MMISLKPCAAGTNVTPHHEDSADQVGGKEARECRVKNPKGRLLRARNVSTVVTEFILSMSKEFCPGSH